MNINLPSKKEILSIPNIMGYFRILLLPFIAYGILNDLYYMEIILLAVSAATDFLDGKIARRFNMVTNLGKALDPIADKLTLCILFICLMIKNDYARVIAAVMLSKELYMLIMQFIVIKKCGTTSGGAKWYGKLCTASLFTALGLFLVFPHMTAILSNIIMIIVVYIMIFTVIMYAYVFRGILTRSTDISMKKKINGKVKKIHPSVRTFFYTFIIILIYIAGGATLPFINHQTVNETFDNSFNLSDYVTPQDLTSSDDSSSIVKCDGPDRIRLVGTNDEALYERIRLIDMANKSIIISSFDFRADESGSDVIAALCDAASRGVDIRILVDGFSGILQMDGKEAFYQLASMPTVQLKIYNPVNVLEPWNLMGRMHDKYVIVDDYGYILGGRNTYNLFLGSYYSDYKNLDMELFVWNENSSSASSINEVKAYFNTIWELPYCKPYNYPANYSASKKSETEASRLNTLITNFRQANSQELSRIDSRENTLSSGKIKLISNPVHRGNKEPYVWNTLYKLMDSANERVYFHTPYIICSDAMYKDFTKIGHKNIDARLLLNAPEIGANPFGSSDYISEKSNVFATGFSIYEYMGNSSYHSKAILIDHNLSIIGSYNADMRSTYLDTEIMLSVESSELNYALEVLMKEAEDQSKQNLSEDNFVIPDSVTEAVFTKKDSIKNKIIIFITRPIRFLL